MGEPIHSTSLLALSPFQNPSLIDDYESGMEASVSSMASGEEELDPPSKLVQDKQMDQTYKSSVSLNYIKSYTTKLANHQGQMSSGNSSTESNATDARAKLKHISSHHAPIKTTHSSAASRISNKKNNIPTPSSGYDGDTEGPVNEDIQI